MHMKSLTNLIHIPPSFIQIKKGSSSSDIHYPVDNQNSHTGELLGLVVKLQGSAELGGSIK
jgi:hypothetical protein